ncbi:hypothetical protein [Streptomyces sp. NPDC005890]|uniref:hypothetical protein n=1 Tax=Streptomyces sp. NPDC005890 TaxID=3154568 RepID=UPI0033D57FDE
MRLVGRRAAEARRNLAHLTERVARHSGLVDWTPPAGGLCCLLGIREPATAQNGTAARPGFGGPEADFRAGLEHLSQFLGQRWPSSGRAGDQGV